MVETLKPSLVAGQGKILEAFRARTRRSAELAEAAGEVFPSGITHDSRRLKPYAVAIERAAGSRKWDVDGNEYVDYSGGHGALLLGHNHPDVAAAVQKQLQLGTHFGSSHPLELQWGRQVKALYPSVERLRFTSSGTEATLLALRLARAHTGRPDVLRLWGHFHGWHDHVALSGPAGEYARPTPGVLDEVASKILVAPPNDLQWLKSLPKERSDRLAAVIVEPTGGSWGQTPLAPGYLEGLIDWARNVGAVVILDEVITGFRCAPGGAQEALGVRGDLTTFAKILAGGLPGGAVGGREEILSQLAFDAPSPSGAPREKIPHQGTFNANPLSAAAGCATLALVATTDACAAASAYAAKLRAGLQEEVERAGLSWCVYGPYSGFHLFTNPDRLPCTPAQIEAGAIPAARIKHGRDGVLLNQLRLAMLCEGVELFSWVGGPTSAVHTPSDLDWTCRAFRASLHALRSEGLA